MIRVDKNVSFSLEHVEQSNCEAENGFCHLQINDIKRPTSQYIDF